MDLLVALQNPNIYIVQEVIVILETPCLETKEEGIYLAFFAPNEWIWNVCKGCH